MSDFSFSDRSSAWFRRAGSETTKGGAAASPQQVYIQLGESQTWANIFRDRYAIPSFEIKDGIIDDLMIGPAVRHKVVRQSIAPGTVVAKGTAVELVVAPTKDLPGRIIPNGHLALADVTMQSAYDQYISDNGVMRRVLERTPDATRLSNEDRATVQEQAAGIEFSEGAGNTVEDFVRSLHLALTMVE